MLLAAAAALTACVGGGASNQLNIDNDGGGRFSGHAGMDFTQDQLRTMVGGQVCGGSQPRQFDVRVLDNNWLFSGAC